MKPLINGKKKGKNGELEVVRLCRAQGYEARRSAQYCGNSEEGAADVVGLPGIHIEVKRVEHLNLDDALAQARRQADDDMRSVLLDIKAMSTRLAKNGHKNCKG